MHRIVIVFNERHFITEEENGNKINNRGRHIRGVFETYAYIITNKLFIHTVVKSSAKRLVMCACEQKAINKRPQQWGIHSYVVSNDCKKKNTHKERKKENNIIIIILFNIVYLLSSAHPAWKLISKTRPYLHTLCCMYRESESNKDTFSNKLHH